MSVDVLSPSAPEYSHTENLYPSLPTSPDAFRLQKISDVQNELEREADHYRQVAKKYKKIFTISHTSEISLGTVTAALSAAGIATAVTGLGAFASVPIGVVAAITGISSTLLTGFGKKYNTSWPNMKNSTHLPLPRKTLFVSWSQRLSMTTQFLTVSLILYFANWKSFMNSKPPFARRAKK